MIYNFFLIWSVYKNHPLEVIILISILARLMGQYCFAVWRLLTVIVVCNAAGGRARRPLGAWAVAGRWAGCRAGCRARGRSGGRHFTAGQYSYVPLGRQLVLFSDHCGWQLLQIVGLGSVLRNKTRSTVAGDLKCREWGTVLDES